MDPWIPGSGTSSGEESAEDGSVRPTTPSGLLPSILSFGSKGEVMEGGGESGVPKETKFDSGSSVKDTRGLYVSTSTVRIR